MSDISAILADLAAGRIDPETAERLIGEVSAPAPERLAADEASGEWPSWNPGGADPSVSDPPSETRARPGKARPVERIAVKASGRRVRIIGDPGVKTAMAEDIHQTRRRPGVLEISGEAEQLSGLRQTWGFIRSVRHLDDIKALGIGQELSIRVNPELDLDIEVTGGSLTTENVPRLGQVRLTAGVATLNRVAQVSDLVVQGGQATISGRFVVGRSRLRVESGQLTVRVDLDSDVTIHADSRVGHISWDTAAQPADSEFVVGDGRAHLDIGVVMGQASVRLGGAEETAEAQR